MKKVILIFPKPWPGSGMAGRLPLSLMYLYSYLKGESFEIEIIDERVCLDIQEQINVCGNDILCFGISCFTGMQIHNGIRIAGLLKNRFPGVPLIWGGWHPTCLPEQTLKHPLVDIIVRGQGEETFKELLNVFLSRKSLSSVKGISYKEGGQIFHNFDRELLPILKKLKLSYDEIDVDKYIFKQPWADRAIGIITSLGCPFKCTFCAVAGVYQRKTFFRNIDFVFEEIDYLVDKYKINALTLDDDNFFVSPERIKEFCEKLINKKYQIKWDAGVHVGLLLKNYDKELLRLIKASGCEQLYVGAESGSDAILGQLEKKATVSQTLEFVSLMKEVGIRPFLSTMVCFPMESHNDIYATMKMILKCRDIAPNLQYRLFYYTPYPGTKLYKTAIRMGMKEPKDLEEWSRHTLRKFRAPWIKRSYRKLIRYFYFYYFPYSGGADYAMDVHSSSSLQLKLLKWVYGLIFGNNLLRKLAKLRVRNFYFKFPVDAYFVIQGQHLKSLYTKIIKKGVDLFCDYED